MTKIVDHLDIEIWRCVCSAGARRPHYLLRSGGRSATFGVTGAISWQELGTAPPRWVMFASILQKVSAASFLKDMGPHVTFIPEYWRDRLQENL